MEDLEQERPIHLREYYHLLLKHKWLILAALIIISTLTTYYTFTTVPVYQATCIMVIDQEKTTSPLTGERLEYDGWLNQSLVIETHIRLITSRPVVWQVIKKNKLDQPEKEKEIALSPVIAVFSDIKKRIRILIGLPKPDPTPLEKQHALIADLRERISIEPVKDTKLLHISAVDYDPGVAADIANSMARSYIEFNLNNRVSNSKNTLNWMSNQLFEIKQKLEDAEEEFLAYKQNEKLFSLEGRQASFSDRIADLNDIYIQTRNRRVEMITKLKELERSDGGLADAQNVRALLNNSLINDLYSRLLSSEIELTRLSKVYKHKHPKLSQAKTALESTREKLRAEIKKELRSIKAELAVFTQKEEALKQNIENFEADALTTNRKELKYTILERNVTAQQRLYDILLQRVKEADITGDVDVSNIRIAETAVAPLAPFKPNKPRQIMLGIILGLMLGIGLAFLRECLDRTLRTEEDVQRHLNLPVLGLIPEAKKERADGAITSAIPHPRPESQTISKRAQNLQRLFLDNRSSKTSFVEAYRTLRININFTALDKRLQSIVITSAIHQEGKSLTSANLAYAVAQAGISVLMIDADLRKPTLGSLVPSSHSKGLSGLLADALGTEVTQGSLAVFEFGDLLRLLSIQKKTGILHLAEQKQKVNLFFLQGKLVDLNWLTRPGDAKLAKVLINSNVITKKQALEALKQQQTIGQRLGYILLQNGHLKQEDLVGPLTIQMMEGFRKALGFRSGTFNFAECAESDFVPSAFAPVDFDKIYKQLFIGEEPIAYLKEKINQAIVKTHIPNLYLLPSGNIPPNPSDLLSSDRMPFLLSNLQKKFDLLVIDTPPVVPVSDALVIASHVDGVLLVAKAGGCNRDLVRKTVENMRMNQINILGVAFNMIDVKSPGYYRYYYKNYGNYYEGK